MPAAKASDPRPKKCWLLTLHSPCQRVSNGYLCHPLPVPNVAFWPENKMKKNDSMKKSTNDPMKKSRKMQMPAAKASDPRPKKCWLLTLHPLSNGYLCHPLPVPNVAFWPENKIKKNANARGQSQRSKTQRMLAPNASSPCQRVSNGYLCHPLPVPNVAFSPF